MEYDSKTRHSVILHSTLSYTRGVNNNVHTKSEYQVRAHMPIYQRPLSPYRRVPGVPGIPCVASAHGPAGPCLPPPPLPSLLPLLPPLKRSNFSESRRLKAVSKWQTATRRQAAQKGVLLREDSILPPPELKTPDPAGDVADAALMEVDRLTEELRALNAEAEAVKVIRLLLLLLNDYIVTTFTTINHLCNIFLTTSLPRPRRRR